MFMKSQYWYSHKEGYQYHNLSFLLRFLAGRSVWNNLNTGVVKLSCPACNSENKMQMSSQDISFQRKHVVWCVCVHCNQAQVNSCKVYYTTIFQVAL